MQEKDNKESNDVETNYDKFIVESRKQKHSTPVRGGFQEKGSIEMNWVFTLRGEEKGGGDAVKKKGCV